MAMADEDDNPQGEEFDEEAVIDEAGPEDLDEDALEEDFEVLEDDDSLLDTDEAADEAADEDDDEAEEAAPRRRVTEDEDEDDDLVAPDDVEADLDTILKDRLVTVEESTDEDEEVEVDDRAGDGDRLQPKRPDEQLCQRCFLLVRRNAPGCPVGDDACPLFS